MRRAHLIELIVAVLYAGGLITVIGYWPKVLHALGLDGMRRLLKHDAAASTARRPRRRKASSGTPGDDRTPMTRPLEDWERETFAALLNSLTEDNEQRGGQER